MIKDISETVSKLWTSWSLLIGATLVFGLLWLLPLSSVLNNEVLELYNKYRGYIGFVALVLLLITLAKILIAAVTITSNKITDWNKGRPSRKANKKRQDTALLRIQYLEKNQRELLKSLIDERQQQFTLPNDGSDYSWIRAYADVVMADIGVPHTEYKIKPRVWKYLTSNLSVLDAEETYETKSNSQA